MISNVDYTLAAMIVLVVWHSSMKNRVLPLERIAERYFLLSREGIAAETRRVLLCLYEHLNQSVRERWNLFSSVVMDLVEGIALNGQFGVLNEFELVNDLLSASEKLGDYETRVVMKVVVNASTLSLFFHDSEILRAAEAMINPERVLAQEEIDSFVSCLVKELIKPTTLALERICGRGFIKAFYGGDLSLEEGRAKNYSSESINIRSEIHHSDGSFSMDELS
jgi:hypothetical protein